MPESSVVDLEALKLRCLGNLNLMERVLNKFARQLDCDLAEMERALEQSDTESFAMLAHRVKGMSANVEARELYNNATAAEQNALEQRLDELTIHLQRMRGDRTRIAESLPHLKMKAL